MISVIVLTNNNQDRIRACLESVKWADEIIICDSGSKDSTLEIAKKYTDKIFSVKDGDFASTRNFGMGKATGEWVIYVDSDERVLEDLKEEIKELIETNEISAYAISRRNIIFGSEVSYGPYKHDWVIRLFKKGDFEKWTGKVHESAKFKGRLGYTKNSLLHLTHRDIDHFILKSLEWSKIDAKLRLEAGHPPMTGWRFFRIFVSELWFQGVVRRGFFNGTIGIMDSILQVFFFYVTYVRLWQMQQSKPLEQIYEEIDQKLLENNFKYS